MERAVEAGEAARRMATLLEGVSDRGDLLIIERDGARIAAVIPIRLYDQWMRSRRLVAQQLREMADEADMTEDEAMSLALEAVRAVRQRG
jgi:hypothetical protein